MGFVNPISIDIFEELYEQLIDPSLLNDFEYQLIDLDLNELIGVEKTMPVVAVFFQHQDTYEKMELTPFITHLPVCVQLGNSEKPLSDLVAKITTELRKTYRFNQREFKRKIFNIINEVCTFRLYQKIQARYSDFILRKAIATCGADDSDYSLYTPTFASSSAALLELKSAKKHINSMIKDLKQCLAFGGNPSQLLSMENKLINMIQIHTYAYHDINYYSQIKNAVPLLE